MLSCPPGPSAANSLDQAFNALVNTTGLLGGTVINVPQDHHRQCGELWYRGSCRDATLTAKATNGYFKGRGETYSSNASGFAQTVAKVDVQGRCDGPRCRGHEGQCRQHLWDSGNSVTDKLGDTLSYAVPVGANVMLLKNEASVTVGQDATVTGDSVKAEAEANLDGTAGTVAAGRNISNRFPARFRLPE